MTTQYMDKNLNCCDCKKDFIFTARDQEFFAQRGFTPPRRCKPCRDQNKLRRESAFQAPQAPRSPSPAPVVQYKHPPVETPSQEDVKKVSGARFSRDYQEDFPGRKGERRRDAYAERRQKKHHRHWEDYFEEDEE